MVRRAEHAGEDLLTVGAAPGAIPAAAHLARHDCGAEGLFGAPMGRIQGRLKEKAEDGLKLGDEVLLKPPDREATTRRALQQAAEAFDVEAARDRQALIGDGAGLVAVARREGRLEGRLHRGHKRLVRVVEQQDATAPEQMRETGLMRGVCKLPIRLPAVALKHAGIVPANHPRRLREAATRLNRIDGGRRRDEGPEPLQIRVNAPAGFIGGDHRTAAHHRTERGIGGVRVSRGAMHRVDQSAARDPQTEAVAQQRRDLAVGQPEPFIQEDGQGDGVRPELHGSRAERIGGLQRMPALHAAPTLRALPDVDREAAHDRPLGRQLLVILRRHADPLHRRGAVRTRGGQRRRVGLVDVRRGATLATRAIGGAGLPARPLRRRDAGASRERRRLPIHGPARRFEFVFQLLVLASQPLAFGFRPPQVCFELHNATPLLVDDRLGILRGPVLVALRHTTVMPDRRSKYKLRNAGQHSLTR